MSLLKSFTADGKPNISLVIVGILISALIGFEIFNFDTTQYALRNLFGGLRFAGIEWAAILAFAFCGIDFAGLIRLFTPQIGFDEPKEVWLLTGAWLIGATMNAVMTWYAVALAINGRSLGTALISYNDILYYAPIFIATLVWLTRILFIGAISITTDRLLHQTALPRQRAPLRQHHPRRQTTSTRANGGIESFEENFFDAP